METNVSPLGLHQRLATRRWCSTKGETFVIVRCPPPYTDVWWLIPLLFVLYELRFWSGWVMLPRSTRPFTHAFRIFNRERNQQDEERLCFLVCSVRLVLWGNVVGGPVCWAQGGATTRSSPLLSLSYACTNYNIMILSNRPEYVWETFWRAPNGF